MLTDKEKEEIDTLGGFMAQAMFWAFITEGAAILENFQVVTIMNALGGSLCGNGD